MSDLIGGAAVYVAVIMSSLGLRSALVSRIGRDDYARFGELLHARGVDAAGVRVERGASTRIVLDYSGQELKSISVIEGVGAAMARADVPASYFATAMAYVAPAPYHTQVKIAEAMKAQGVLVCFDPHADFNSQPFSVTSKILRNVDVFFANESEVLALSKERTLEQAASKIQNTGPTIVVVTQGERGSTIFSGEDVLTIPALAPSNVVDVVGAGDAYKAGFLAGLRKRLSLRCCGVIGAATASCVLEGPGLQVVPSVRMVEQVLSRNSMLATGPC